LRSDEAHIAGKSVEISEFVGDKLGCWSATEVEKAP
jgi:hypothetical protein